MNIKEHKKQLVAYICLALRSGKILCDDKGFMDDDESERRCEAECKLADELGRRYRVE